ncbi:EVE domain-containing protein [Phototrophicus methaneseepsis]|uniref:UPF0310 protein G4Y79_23120 n=1 Tax=Phototrophicus methaneseepsis TaxID=2710758 RepID=A0A7S8IF43_9CHLR|nr:EVE domain-containing protein [Phototrophicus methaneseepsis]QPC82543.1 EVE domain-containing protein [Phototrophicus methaneseepsis]
MSQHYWVGVVVKDHILKGVDGGFCQLGHGKKSYVQRLAPGDWLVYYAPRTTLKDGDPVRAFVALGQVKEGDVYQHQEASDFHPWRRDIDYSSGTEADIYPLLDQLSFIQDRTHWGMQFRRSLFEVSRADFEIITEAMGVSLP